MRCYFGHFFKIAAERSRDDHASCALHIHQLVPVPNLPKGVRFLTVVNKLQRITDLWSTSYKDCLYR